MKTQQFNFEARLSPQQSNCVTPFLSLVAPAVHHSAHHQEHHHAR